MFSPSFPTLRHRTIPRRPAHFLRPRSICGIGMAGPEPRLVAAVHPLPLVFGTLIAIALPFIIIADDIVRKKEVGPLDVLAAWLVMLVTLTMLRQLVVPRIFADHRTVHLAQGFLLTVLRFTGYGPAGAMLVVWACRPWPIYGICAIATSVLAVGVYCVVDRPRSTEISSAWGGRAKAK